MRIKDGVNVANQNSVEIKDGVNYSLSSVDELYDGNLVIANDFVDLRKKRVKINVVLLIQTYGFDTGRYRITEKVFRHYRNIQYIFSKWANFSFTVVGSEKKYPET